MKTPTPMLSLLSGLLLGGSSLISANQKMLEVSDYEIIASELNICLTTAGVCLDEDTNKINFKLKDPVICNDKPNHQWVTSLDTASDLRRSVVESSARVPADVKQIMMVRVDNSKNSVDSTLMNALNQNGVMVEDYLRCQPTPNPKSIQEYLYVYGTASEVEAVMEESKLVFNPPIAFSVPDTIKVSPSVRVLMKEGEEGSRDITDTFSMSIVFAKGNPNHQEDGDMNDVMGRISNHLNSNRRRRLRDITGEKDKFSSLPSINIRDVGARTLVAENMHIEDLIFEDGNINILDMPSVMFLDQQSEYTTTNVDASLLVQTGEEAKIKEEINEKQLVFWENGVTGKGQVVGVGDTGIATNHCMFKDENVTMANMTQSEVNKFPTHRKITSYFAFADAVEGTRIGHGTHVAGTVAGDGGSLKTRGIAYEAKIHFSDFGSFQNALDPFFRPDREYLFPPDDASTYLDPVVADGGRIHTNSWGCASCVGYTRDGQTLDEYQYVNQDFLVIFPAGNNGDGNVTNPTVDGHIYTPANSKNCLTVGAQQTSFRADYSNDGEDYSCGGKLSQMYGGEYEDDFCTESGEDHIMSENMEWFSGGGALWDGRIGIDVVAIGVTWSARSIPENPDTCLLRAFSGTSQAAAVAAGSATLVRQYFVDGYYPSGAKTEADAFTPMAALIKAVLINGARLLKGKYGFHPWLDGEKLTGKIDSIQGFGSISLSSNLPLNNPMNAAALSKRGLFLDGDFDSMRTIENGEEIVYEFTVEDGDSQPFKATLVWNDPAAALTASQALINDLNLMVEHYNADVDELETYYPNNLREEDRVNNVEHIEIPVGHRNGVYRVRITGAIVPQGPQPIALVVAGGFSIVNIVTPPPVAIVPTTPRPTLPPITPTTVPPTFAPTLPPKDCVDQPLGWFSLYKGPKYGSCEYYGEIGFGRCADERGRNFPTNVTHPWFNITQNQACCICGGGSTRFQIPEDIEDPEEDIEETKDEDDKNITMYVLFASGGLFVLALIGVSMRVRNKSKNSQQPKYNLEAATLITAENPNFQGKV